MMNRKPRSEALRAGALKNPFGEAERDASFIVLCASFISPVLSVFE